MITINANTKLATIFKQHPGALETIIGISPLGLVYQVDFDEPGSQIVVSMTLSTPYCPMGESISHERISEAGKKFLTE